MLHIHLSDWRDTTVISAVNVIPATNDNMHPLIMEALNRGHSHYVILVDTPSINVLYYTTTNSFNKRQSSWDQSVCY